MADVNQDIIRLQNEVKKILSGQNVRMIRWVLNPIIEEAGLTSVYMPSISEISDIDSGDSMKISEGK